MSIFSAFILAIFMLLMAAGLIALPVLALYETNNGNYAGSLALIILACCLYFVAPLLSKSKKASAEKEKALTPEEIQAKAEKDELAHANSERLRKQLQLHRTIQNMQGYDARCPRCGSADISVTKKQATTDYTWEDGIGIDGRWALVPMPTPGKPKVFMRCNRCGKKFKL